MRLDRLVYDPAALVDFYEQGFGALGALHEVELTFASADATGARDSVREVFPGCPLTFRLAEALRPAAVGTDCAGRRSPRPACRA